MRIQGTRNNKNKGTKNHENTRNQGTIRINTEPKKWEYKEPRNHENTRNQETIKIKGTKNHENTRNQGTISNEYLRNYSFIKYNKNMQD